MIPNTNPNIRVSIKNADEHYARRPIVAWC